MGMPKSKEITHHPKTGTKLNAEDRESAMVVQDAAERVFMNNIDVLVGAACFADFDPDKGPSKEWMDQWGSEERAQKMLRLARYSMMNPKEAPVGLKMASTVVLGVLKFREKHSNQGSGFGAGNAIEMPVQTFPTQEVDD